MLLIYRKRVALHNIKALLAHQYFRAKKCYLPNKYLCYVNFCFANASVLQFEKKSPFEQFGGYVF